MQHYEDEINALNMPRADSSISGTENSANIAIVAGHHKPPIGDRRQVTLRNASVHVSARRCVCTQVGACVGACAHVHAYVHAYMRVLFVVRIVRRRVSYASCVRHLCCTLYGCIDVG